MSKIDRIKEEIGWLKVAFALLVAVDISLIGWTAQNYETTSTLLLSLVVLAVILVTFVIVFINRYVYRKFDELGDL